MNFNPIYIFNDFRSDQASANNAANIPNNGQKKDFSKG